MKILDYPPVERDPEKTHLNRTGRNQGKSLRKKTLKSLENLLHSDNLKYLTMKERKQIQEMINRIQAGGNVDGD